MVKEIKSQEEFNTVMHSDDANNVSWCPRCGRAYAICMEWISDDCLLRRVLEGAV